VRARMRMRVKASDTMSLLLNGLIQRRHYLFLGIGIGSLNEPHHQLQQLRNNNTHPGCYQLHSRLDSSHFSLHCVLYHWSINRSKLLHCTAQSTLRGAFVFVLQWLECLLGVGLRVLQNARQIVTCHIRPRHSCWHQRLFEQCL
jgi:hypothetical protein